MPDESEGPRQIMAFGKFGTYKRVEDLVDAFRLLKQSETYRDVELVIAGESPIWIVSHAA